MLFSNQADSHYQPRALARRFASVALAIVLAGSMTGCSPLWHRPQQRQLSNPWIKPEKPDRSAWVKNIFLREKKQPDTPGKWIGQERPEWRDQE